MRKAVLQLVLAVLLLSFPGVATAAADDDFARFEASAQAAREAMMGDPRDALVAAERAVAIAADLPGSRRASEAQATAGWLHAESLIYLNRLEDAEPIVESALEKVEAAAPDSKLHGDLLRSQGALRATQGRMLEALRDYQGAFRVFSAAGIERSQAIALQDIGLIYFEAEDYARALDYYRQSAEVYSDDPVLTLTMHNNRAEVLRKQGRHAAASDEYRKALRNARDLDSPLLVTRILTNLAGSQVDERRLGEASESIAEAQRLAAHGDAAGWRPFVDGVAAKLALKRGDLASARKFIERTFAAEDLAKTELLFREYHQTAAQIYERLGDEQAALVHFKAFQRLDAEARQATASTASQLLGARFDFANQNLRIANLKQGQLQRDIQIERQKAGLRNAMLVAGGVLLSVLLIGFISIRRSRDEVRAANNTLTGVNAELEKALKAKTEFLATTSHEIRTPLNGILGMTQVLLSDRTVTHSIRERIEVAHAAGETMRALVDDILDVAKIESGQMSVTHEHVDLVAILKDARRLWEAQAGAKGIELVLQADVPGPILSDGGRLRQIVFNLLSNAVKFTHSGRIGIEAAACASEAGTLEIRVTDTGIGIPEASREEIFEPFRQVQGGMARHYSGTGLGLAICHRLAQALGGSLSVESVEGEGSTFTVTLPLELADRGDRSSEDGDVPADAGLAAAKLLLVDADAKNLGVMSILFAPHVAAVTRAASLEEARDELGDATHLLVSTGASEPDTLRAFVEAGQSAGLRITLLHAPGDGSSVADMMMLGADQLVIKPIGSQDLLAALRSLYSGEPETFVAPALLCAAAA